MGMYFLDEVLRLPTSTKEEREVKFRQLCEIATIIQLDARGPGKYDHQQEALMTGQAASLANDVDDIMSFAKNAHLYSTCNLAIAQYAKKLRLQKKPLTDYHQVKQLARSINVLDVTSADAARKELAKICSPKVITENPYTSSLSAIAEMSYVAYLCEDHKERENFLKFLAIAAIRKISSTARLISFCQQLEVVWFRNKLLVLWAKSGKAIAGEGVKLIRALYNGPAIENVDIESGIKIIKDALAHTEPALASFEMQHPVETHGHLGLDPARDIYEASREIERQKKIKGKKK